MTKNRDRAYWDDVVCAVYIETGMGNFDEVIAKVAERYPEFQEFLDQDSLDRAERQTRRDFVHRLKTRFDEADRNEHEYPNPTPPHLRAQFLPFDIAIPPMSPSVIAAGFGRVPSAIATPKQHKRHHGSLKQWHARGVAYREECESKWADVIEEFRNRLPEIDHPENLTLDEILERMAKTADEKEYQPV